MAFNKCLKMLMKMISCENFLENLWVIEELSCSSNYDNRYETIGRRKTNDELFFSVCSINERVNIQLHIRPILIVQIT